MFSPQGEIELKGFKVSYKNNAIKVIQLHNKEKE
jgi:hypothetical protein